MGQAGQGQVIRLKIWALFQERAGVAAEGLYQSDVMTNQLTLGSESSGGLLM